MAASDIDELLEWLRKQEERERQVQHCKNILMANPNFVQDSAKKEADRYARWIAAVEELREAAALWKATHGRTEPTEAVVLGECTWPRNPCKRLTRLRRNRNRPIEEVTDGHPTES